jgi:hypothetical protein
MFVQKACKRGISYFAVDKQSVWGCYFSLKELCNGSSTLLSVSGTIVMTASLFSLFEISDVLF